MRWKKYQRGLSLGRRVRQSRGRWLTAQARESESTAQLRRGSQAQPRGCLRGSLGHSRPGRPELGLAGQGVARCSTGEGSNGAGSQRAAGSKRSCSRAPVGRATRFCRAVTDRLNHFGRAWLGRAYHFGRAVFGMATCFCRAITDRVTHFGRAVSGRATHSGRAGMGRAGCVGRAGGSSRKASTLDQRVLARPTCA